MARHFTGRSNSANNRAPRPTGELRQSQLVTTFGPGAMVDLVDRSVLIGGLEHWGFAGGIPVSYDEPRLKRALQPRIKALGDLALHNYFRAPPAADGEAENARSDVGVRVLEFPRWFACQKCRRLATRESFELKKERYKHECKKGETGEAIPVRFVAACARGHLSEFPWDNFVHREGGIERCASPELLLEENAIGDVAQIFVKCNACKASRPMGDATLMPFQCRGERPWLGGLSCNESCDEPLKLLVRTASHAYFGQVVSALRLPEEAVSKWHDALHSKDVWETVHRAESEAQLTLLVKLVPALAHALGGLPVADLYAAICAEREKVEKTEEAPLRTEEFSRFTKAENELPGTVVGPNERFAAFRVPPHAANLPDGVDRLVLVPELREVRVQVAFSRFSSVMADLQGQYDFDARGVKPAALTAEGGREKWLPATEIRGEGIFLALDEEAVRAWERRPCVEDRAERLRAALEKDPNAQFFGARYYMLHSLAHLLLTTISLECGYAASAIRERIYCGREGILDESPMAGLLLYTGTTGSEGTLGGLVEEGRMIRDHLRTAWDLGGLCSNDPVCSAHDPSADPSDRNTEGAACHGCLYIAESSCERFNRHLDRALVVPTLGNDPELAFFQKRP